MKLLSLTLLLFIVHTNLYSQSKNWSDSILEKGNYFELIGQDENKTIYYQSNKRDEKYLDIYTHEYGAINDELIYQNNDGYLINSNYGIDQVFTKDKSTIVLSKLLTNKHQLIHFYDLKTKELSTPHTIPMDSNTKLNPLFFNTDNELILTSDYKSEFAFLASYNLKTQKFKQLFQTEGEIEFVDEVNPNEYSIILNNKGFSEIWLQNKERILVRKFDGYIPNYKIECSDSTISFYFASPNIGLQQLNLNFRTKVLSPIKFINESISVEKVTYVSDSILISGYLIHPRNKLTPKTPLVVYIHGGPQFHQPYYQLKAFDSTFTLKNSVFVPNIRGSIGYGKSFFHMDDGKHATVAPEDIKNGIKHVIDKYKFIDSTNIVLTGSSYGGFAIYVTLIKYPDLVNNAVVSNAVYNYKDALKIMPKFWEVIRADKYAEFDFYSPDFSSKYIILDQLKNITTPTVILQGTEDPLFDIPKLEKDLNGLNNPHLKLIFVDNCGHDIYRHPEGSKLNQQTIQELIDGKYVW